MRYFVVFKSANTWEQRKLGECFDERTERSADGELIAVTINSGVVKASELNRHDNSSEDKSNYKVVRVNDIAYNSMRMWQGASGYSQYDGILSPAYTVVIPRENVNPVFFSYMFKRTDMIHEFQINSQGLTSDTWNLKFPAFSTISANVPKSEEQQAIGNYFTNLDNLITLHQRSYNLEQKSKTTNAWEQRELGEVTEDFVEKSTVENQYPVLTSSQQKGIVLQDDYFAGDRVSQSGNLGYFIIPRGYFAYRSRSDNDVFVFNRNDCVDMGIISYFYPVFKPKNVDSDFLLRRLNNGLETQLRISSEGTGQHVLSLKKFKNMTTLFPTISEQQKIGAYFKSLDNLITLHQRNSYGLHLPQGLYPSAIAWS